jgi:hypothetical protein
MMNLLARWLYWMDREDPRWQRSLLARAGYHVVCLLGLLFLLIFPRLPLRMFIRFGWLKAKGQ